MIGVLAISTGASLVRLIETAPALVKATWRTLLAGAVMLPLALTRPSARRSLLALQPFQARGMLVAASALALHFGLWIPSLDFTSVASSVVLVTSSPLFVAALSGPLLGETVGRRVRFGVGLAFVGSAVVGWGDLAFDRRALIGDGLALGGAVAAAAYFIAGRRVRSGLPLLAYLACVYLGAGAILALACVALGLPLFGYDSRTWLLLALLALLPQIAGHGALNWALAQMSAAVVAVVTLGEPIGSTLIAWAILGEAPAVSAVLGGLLILLGVALAARAEVDAANSSNRQRATKPASRFVQQPAESSEET